MLDLIDKSTQRTVASWQADGTPLMQLSGPAPNVLLTDTDAYYVTVHDEAGSTRNSVNGEYDFNRLHLADGARQQVPLPRTCVACRVVSLAGSPVIYAWNGYGVWTFDARRGSLRELAGHGEFADILRVERARNRAEQLPTGSTAQFVAVPEVGLFRLSRAGDLHQILKADLTPVPPPHKAIALGTGKIEQLFATSLAGRPVIGFVRKNAAGQVALGFLDPRTATLEAPQVAMPHSEAASSDIVRASGEDLYYFAPSTNTIERVSKQGTMTIWKLQDDAAAVNTTLVLVNQAG